MRIQFEPLVINGSHGEGGGALLRTALTMSALTQHAVRVHNVRGAMRKAGLNSEDLTVLAALAASCQAEVDGDELESSEFTFAPTRPARALEQRFDVAAHEKGTVPGSAPVIVESLLPVLARAGAYSRISVLGETHGQNTLGYDAFERVSLPVHREQGLYAFVDLAWAGFGFGSRGELSAEVEPSVLEPVDWPERGSLVGCRAVVSYADVSEDIAERGARRIRQLFSEKGQAVDVEQVPVRARVPGVSVTLWAEFERGWGSGTALGQRGLRVELVVDNAWRSFQEWYDSPATVDAHLADQMLPLAVLAEGRTVYTTPRVTRRLVTMSWVIKQFLPVHITIKGEEGYSGTVTVER